MDKSDEQLINDLLERKTMDNQGREYHFQADWTVGTRMFHVRFDDFEQFTAAVKAMEGILPQTKPFPDDVGQYATPQTKVQEVPECEIHKVPMTYRPAGVSKTTGKPYPGFYSCGVKDANNKFCSFRPKI